MVISGEPAPVRLSSQAEVEHLDLAFAGQDEVRRLDVPVDQAVLVGALKAEGRLADQLASVGHGEGGAKPHEAGQVDPIDEFHHQEMDPAGLAGVGGPHDVMVIQAADRLHLPLEPGHGPAVRRRLGGEDLDRELLLQQGMEGPVDPTPSPLPDLLHDPILAQHERRRQTRGETPWGWLGGETISDSPGRPGSRAPRTEINRRGEVLTR